MIVAQPDTMYPADTVYLPQFYRAGGYPMGSGIGGGLLEIGPLVCLDFVTARPHDVHLISFAGFNSCDNLYCGAALRNCLSASAQRWCTSAASQAVCVASQMNLTCCELSDEP